MTDWRRRRSESTAYLQSKQSQMVRQSFQIAEAERNDKYPNPFSTKSFLRKGVNRVHGQAARQEVDAPVVWRPPNLINGLLHKRLAVLLEVGKGGREVGGRFWDSLRCSRYAS